MTRRRGGGRGLCRGASRAEIAAATLDRLRLDHIARFKRLRHHRFVDALPKNNYGKVLKTELRRLLAEPASGANGIP